MLLIRNEQLCSFAGGCLRVINNHIKIMLKILIVDDNADMRRLIKTIVRKMSATVFECEDGDEVSEAFDKYHPDWILMDVEMKRMDGLEATRQILANFPGVRILLVTQYNTKELREAAQTAGVCGYLLKENLMDLRRLLS